VDRKTDQGVARQDGGDILDAVGRKRVTFKPLNSRGQGRATVIRRQRREYFVAILSIITLDLWLDFDDVARMSEAICGYHAKTPMSLRSSRLRL
jgi:hypothetical protein